MAEETILRDEIRRSVEEIGAADILVGIPSYNNSRTIGHVVHAVTAGLAKYFPDQRAVLINSDGGSQDGTPEAVAQADYGNTQTLLVAHPVRVVPRLLTAYQGLPGKGSAFRTIFEIATRLQARACAVVDADLRSITPEWIELLIAPVLKESFDYVCPLYSRHKYDGTITNSIVYPLVRALYGKRIRQPIGGDFGFSGALAAHFLDHDVWTSDVARYGIDIWMTTTALLGGYRVCQAYLGAKLHDAKDPGADLTAMLVQVTGSLLKQVEEHSHSWSKVVGSEPVPEFGFRYEVGLEPIAVNTARMVRAFELGVREFEPLYAAFLSAELRRALAQLGGQAADSFQMPPETWVQVVHEFVLGYHHRRLAPDHLLKSLTPLYLGRTASWVNQAAPLGATEVERELDALCVLFEAAKPDLVDRWTPGRTP